VKSILSLSLSGLFLSTTLCLPLAEAAKPISLKDVVSAFTWMKLGPHFPVTINTQSENQVSFRVFDDVYTIKNGDQTLYQATPDSEVNYEQNFKINRLSFQHGSSTSNQEAIVLSGHTVEKILKFVQAQERSSGALEPQVFLESIHENTPPAGYQFSKSLYQCRSDLPSRITHNGSVVNEILQHTWIQNGAAESFGMPNTDAGTYFGGSAHIRTPDSFIIRGPKRLECAPVLIPDTLSAEKISKKALCVARSISLPQDPIFTEGALNQDWIAHFDYHALERNCLVAVRFALECAGAAAPQVVNAGIGGTLRWDDVYSVSAVTLEEKAGIAELQESLKKFRELDSISTLPEVAEDLLNQAIGVDAGLRGVSGNSIPKNLREICDFALQKCAN